MDLGWRRNADRLGARYRRSADQPERRNFIGCEWRTKRVAENVTCGSSHVARNLRVWTDGADHHAIEAADDPHSIWTSANLATE